MCMDIVQHLCKPRKLHLIGWDKRRLVFLLMYQDQKEGFTQKALDFQLIAVRLFVEQRIDLLQLFQHLFPPRFRPRNAQAGNRGILQKRPETVALDIASEIAVQKIGAHEDRRVLCPFVVRRMAAVRHIAVHKQPVSQ